MVRPMGDEVRLLTFAPGESLERSGGFVGHRCQGFGRRAQVGRAVVDVVGARGGGR